MMWGLVLRAYPHRIRMPDSSRSVESDRNSLRLLAMQICFYRTGSSGIPIGASEYLHLNQRVNIYI